MQKYCNLPLDLPNEIYNLDNEQLINKIEESGEVHECLRELVALYKEIKTSQCFRVPFVRNQVVELILNGNRAKGKVLGYEYSIRPNGEMSDLIMIGFYKDRRMKKFDKVLAFPIEKFIEEIDGVPVAPDIAVLAFGGQSDKKVKKV